MFGHSGPVERGVLVWGFFLLLNVYFSFLCFIHARYQSFLYLFCSYVRCLNVFVPYCRAPVVQIGLNRLSTIIYHSWAVSFLLF